MSGRIPREFIDDLLVRVDIVDLIDSRLPLKKSGANYVACCPFHTEKTPSFSVSRKKQFYHCFGCGASGNAISFLMDFNHLEFVEAVEDLATFIGIEVPREAVGQKNQPPKESLDALLALMEQVALFYVTELQASPKANDYVKTRGINTETAREFALGYAPDKWDALSGRFNQDLLIQAGLLIKKDDGKAYDPFRGRLMFPIRDKRGRIIGFGGRVLDDSLPKYKNSPETRLFHKGKEVYGLYELLKKNSKPARILIVEGYLDVIALAQYGVHYAVATLGTATSEAHLELLFRFSSELVLCFDGDKAGVNAAWKAIAAIFPCLKGGRAVHIMLLPQSHDPDSLIREQGLETFEQRVETAQVLSDYFFEHFSKDLSLSNMESRSRLIEEAKSFLSQLPIGAYREMMVAKLSSLADLHVKDHESIRAYQNLDRKNQQKTVRPSLPRVALALLIQHPELAKILDEKAVEIDTLDFAGVDFFKKILQIIHQYKPLNSAALLEYYRDTSEEKTVKALAGLPVPDERVELEFYDTIMSLKTMADKINIEQSLANAQSENELKDLARLITRAKSEKF
jgi:DNA primase